MNVILRKAKIIDPKSPFHTQILDVEIDNGIITKIGEKLENENHFEEINLEEDLPTEIQIKLSQNLKLISESCQIILKLFYYRGLTIDEIVEQTEYKDPNTVRSHKSRCLKRLKTLFKVQ